MVCWIIFYFFLLTIFFYMLYNSKWSKIFQICSQLALKKESKEAPPTWTFFHTNVTLWSAVAPLLQGLNKDFCQFKCSYLATDMLKISEFFFASYQTNTLQDHLVTCVHNDARVWVGSNEQWALSNKKLNLSAH